MRMENSYTPDVVVHRRGTQDGNLIIIQAKKFNDADDEVNRAKEDLVSDKAFLRYQNAFLVVFPENAEALGDESVWEF